MAMRCLVTGGAGFVGSHLCECLLSQGHQVTALDNLSTGRYENVAHLEGNSAFRLLIASVQEAELTEQLIREHDTVYHLASAVGVRLIMERPVQTVESIYQCTDLVLRYARRYRRRVLLTSTSEVYGKSTDVPFREDGDRLQGPTSKNRWAYACAKALDEFLALAHYHETRLPVVIVRLFNTAGPRQSGHYGMVLPTFVRQALAGGPLTVHGTGEQTRCFVHVLDVVEALVKLVGTPVAYGRVVNIGSQEEVTINELAARVKQAAGVSAEIVHVPYASAYGEQFEDMARRVPALERARELIGYEPRRNLDQIIADVVAWFRKGG